MRFLRFGAAFVAFAVAFPVHAADPQPYPDFTFKRSKPPKAGERKLITVQIDPEEQAAILAARPNAQGIERSAPEVDDADPETAQLPNVAVPDTSAAYPWFWTKVSDAIATDASDRMRSAFGALSEGPDGATVKGPRLQVVQEIAKARGADILRATIGTDVSPALVLAVISVESAGKSDAVSGAGARGLMQLMPATAERFGVTDSFASDQNIKGGVAYLDWLLKEFGGDAVLALAGYNAGENAVKKHDGVPPFDETRDYIPKVLAAFQVASGLCKTRPELITDACALTLASN